MSITAVYPVYAPDYSYNDKHEKQSPALVDIIILQRFVRDRRISEMTPFVMSLAGLSFVLTEDRI